MEGSAFCRLEASGPRPCCPFCGRRAGSWFAVPLCQACRNRLAALPRSERRAALAEAHSRAQFSPKGGQPPLF